MASTYTPTTQDTTHAGRAWFQDCQISPATLADGSLASRFDTRKYPELGDIANAAAGETVVTVGISPATPQADQAFTLTALIAGVEGEEPGGTVQFKDGAGNLSTPQTVTNGVATLTEAGGLAAGAHSFTAVYSGDRVNPGATSAAVAPTFGADTTAPGPVTGLGHTNLAATSLTLNWTNPAASDFAGVVVRYAAGAVAPADHSAGTLVSDVAAPAATVGVTGLTTATQYTFAAFAHDGSGNYAAAATHTVTTS